MIGRIYREMVPEIGARQAIAILTRVIERAAFEDGRAFARTAKPGPSLEHFRTILDNWGDAMGIANLASDGRTLRFDVTRCDYVSSYRDLGLPVELVGLLSCRRDAPFARGYSDRLAFSRERTLAEGAPTCDFCYHWSSHP